MQEEEEFLHHQLATVQQEVQDALHARSYSITAVLILRLMLCNEGYVMQLGVVCCGVRNAVEEVLSSDRLAYGDTPLLLLLGPGVSS